MNHLHRAARRIAMTIGFFKTVEPSQEGGATQLLKAAPLAPTGETFDKVRSLQNYGHASALLPGTEMVVAFAGGNRGQGVVIATNHPSHRPLNLAPGESCLHDNTGTTILLKADGSVVVTASGNTVQIVGDTSITGSLTVTKEIIWNAATAPTHASSHNHANSGGPNPGGPPIAGS